jgi:hypothetical protein
VTRDDFFHHSILFDQLDFSFWGFLLKIASFSVAGEDAKALLQLLVTLDDQQFNQ